MVVWRCFCSPVFKDGGEVGFICICIYIFFSGGRMKDCVCESGL